jgi:hypothetical protein
MLDQACQAVDVLAKVDGIAVQVHDSAGIQRKRSVNYVIA